ncbi:MAG: endonuclease domain-containing protein [Xanthobacteraceae bacterium]
MTHNFAAAKRLRRNQTDAERLLWFRLRDRRLEGLKFKRQVPIYEYVVDFCCSDARLIVELDGSQHAVRTRSDAARTKRLEELGYLVLRFWNNDVLSNIDGVLETIVSTAKQHSPEPPHPNPLPHGERESV